ncbi:MAG: pectin acetylesterase-family hydrolase [Microthrixaceae bacterium]
MSTTRSRATRIAVGASAALALLIGSACSTSRSSTRHPTSSTATDRTTTVAESPSSGDVASWRKLVAPNPCGCSDGSPFHFWVHRGDPSKVLFFLDGGGACFSRATCGPDQPTYTRNLTGNTSPTDSGGIFDLENPKNPFRDFSIVRVPYCTGDVHLGDAVHDYGDGVVIRHRGNVNAGTALTTTAALFPDAEQVVVAGESAGSAGSPLYAGLAHDAFPDAAISLVADGSAAYPGTEGITLAIGSLWGVTNAIPTWPETAGRPTRDFSLPGLFGYAKRHDPTLRVATINHAYDRTQEEFTRAAGFGDTDLLKLIDDNIAQIKADGVTVHDWVAPGRAHTIIGTSGFYTARVNGVALVDWLGDFVSGKDVPDEHCTDCHAES